MLLEELMKDRKEFVKFLKEAKQDRVKDTLAEAITKLEMKIRQEAKRALSAYPKCGEKRKYWSHDETKALLSCYAKRKDEFNCFRKKKRAYENVLKDLIDLDVLVTPTTPEGVQTKMKGLWRAYKDSKIGNVGKAKCIEHFDKELDYIFGSAIAMNKNFGDADDVHEEEGITESFSPLYESDETNLLDQKTVDDLAINDALDCIDENPKIWWSPKKTDVDVEVAETYKPLTKSISSSTSSVIGNRYSCINQKPSIMWIPEENLDAAALNEPVSSCFIASTNTLKRKSKDDEKINANDNANGKPSEEKKEKLRLTFKERAFKEKISFLKQKEENKMKRWEEKKEMLRLQTENKNKEKQHRFEEKLKLINKLTDVIKITPKIR